MPLIKGDDDSTKRNENYFVIRKKQTNRPKIDKSFAGQNKNGKKLLSGAAFIMSVLLVGSSIITSMLIPAEKFQVGGEANGRAISYLAHTYAWAKCSAHFTTSARF